jgi:hypothetical protein
VHYKKFILGLKCEKIEFGGQITNF